MKFYTVYKTTNLINNKIYIGKHVTKNLNDGYLGSGTNLFKAIDKYGKENFKKEILFVYDNEIDMNSKENELLTEEFVKSDQNYNISIGGSSGMLGKTHTEEVRKVLSEMNSKNVSVKDSNGNNFKVSKDDPRYLSGELKHNTHGTVVVKDETGHKFRVPITDDRWLNGKLIGANEGNVRPKETIEKHTKFMKKYWSENSHTEVGLEKMRLANIGKVNVKDVNGKEFRVSKNDPRYLSGELVVAFKNSVWVHKDELQKSKCVRPEKLQQFLDDGWIRGLVYYNKEIRKWITHDELNLSKQCKETEINNYINLGWRLGKKRNELLGEMIRAGRTKKYKWMHNPITKECTMIAEDQIHEFINNGWLIGRILSK